MLVFRVAYSNSINEKLSIMKTSRNIIVSLLIWLATAPAVFSQATPKKVVITGVRFSYPLVSSWIESYKAANPDAVIQIESRGVTDPAQYDLLIEAYEPDSAAKQNRDFVYIGQYALLPVANAQSAFAKQYLEKGLTGDLIKQVYFNDVYADKKNSKKIEANYTVYTRLQKAGAPITFARYFGYEQSNIKGKTIAGADEHLIKALLKDTTAISYTTLGLAYDVKTRLQVNGLVVLPVDTDDNKRVSNEEKEYGSLDKVITQLEGDELKNIPVAYLHVSIHHDNTNAEALKFLQWILENGRDNLNQFGFLKPEPRRFQQEKEKLLKQLTLN